VNRQTAGLVDALHAVNRHVPSVAIALLTGTLPIGKQREFAELLTDLGDLLNSHANDQGAGIVPVPTVPPDSDDSHWW
jgi:hypothetical protein